MSRIFVACGCAALALTLGGPLWADETEIWQYQCLGDEIVGGRICTTELATLDGDSEFVIYFVHSEGAAPPLVVAGDVEGMSVASIRVNKDDPVETQLCDDGACSFAAEDSALLLKQFRRGRTATVTIRGAGGEVLFERGLTLRGFSAALVASEP